MAKIVAEKTLTPIAFKYEYDGVPTLPTLTYIDGCFAGRITRSFEYGRDYQDIGYSAEILGRDVSFITQGMGSWDNQNLKDRDLGIRRELLKEKTKGIYVFGPGGKPFDFYVPSKYEPQFSVYTKEPQRFKKQPK